MVFFLAALLSFFLHSRSILLSSWAMFQSPGELEEICSIAKMEKGL